jgi:hypothetical protein
MQGSPEKKKKKKKKKADLLARLLDLLMKTFTVQVIWEIECPWP